MTAPEYGVSLVRKVSRWALVPSGAMTKRSLYWICSEPGSERPQLRVKAISLPSGDQEGAVSVSLTQSGAPASQSGPS